MTAVRGQQGGPWAACSVGCQGLSQVWQEPGWAWLSGACNASPFPQFPRAWDKASSVPSCQALLPSPYPCPPPPRLALASWAPTPAPWGLCSQPLSPWCTPCCPISSCFPDSCPSPSGSPGACRAHHRAPMQLGLSPMRGSARGPWRAPPTRWAPGELQGHPSPASSRQPVQTRDPAWPSWWGGSTSLLSCRLCSPVGGSQSGQETPEDSGRPGVGSQCFIGRPLPAPPEASKVTQTILKGFPCVCQASRRTVCVVCVRVGCVYVVCALPRHSA